MGRMWAFTGAFAVRRPVRIRIRRAHERSLDLHPDRRKGVGLQTVSDTGTVNPVETERLGGGVSSYCESRVPCPPKTGPGVLLVTWAEERGSNTEQQAQTRAGHL